MIRSVFGTRWLQNVHRREFSQKFAILNKGNYQSIFEQKPFNYKELRKRFDIVSGENISGDSNETLYEEVLISAIKSCRKLQLEDSKTKLGTAFETRKTNDLKVDEILDNEEKKTTIANQNSASKRDIEKLLSDFLLNNRNREINSIVYDNKKNDKIIKNYLLIKPVPDSFEIVDFVEKLNSKMASGIALNDNNVKVATRVILNNSKSTAVDNFENSFILIDLTFGSKKYADSISRKFFSKYIPSYIACFFSLEFLSTFLFDKFTMEFIGTSTISSTGLNLMIGSYLLNVSLLGFISALGFFTSKTKRVKWRPGVSFWYKILHHKELISYEKIFTNYEELYDLNANNFHLLGSKSSPESINSPESVSGIKSLISNSNCNENNKDGSIKFEYDNTSDKINYEVLNEKQKLSTFFRENLRKKRLSIEEYTDQELLFQEYWVSNGENFEWVDPDQDPAEIEILKKTEVEVGNSSK